MAVIWIEEPEDRRMDAKNLKNTRRRLSSEYENLIKSIKRSRLAAEATKLEHTEDEGDLETEGGPEGPPLRRGPRPRQTSWALTSQTDV